MKIDIPRTRFTGPFECFATPPLVERVVDSARVADFQSQIAAQQPGPADVDARPHDPPTLRTRAGDFVSDPAAFDAPTVEQTASLNRLSADVGVVTYLGRWASRKDTEGADEGRTAELIVVRGGRMARILGLTTLRVFAKSASPDAKPE